MKLERIRFASLLCGVSAALAAAVISLWSRSLAPARDQASLRVGRDRYTIRSEPNWLVLYGPPAPWPAHEAQAAERFAERLSNDNAGWMAWARRGATGAYEVTNAHPWLVGDDGTKLKWPPDPASPLAVFLLKPGALAPAFLRALEDPGRFRIAHHVLGEMGTAPYHQGMRVVVERRGDLFLKTNDGLQSGLRRVAPDRLDGRFAVVTESGPDVTMLIRGDAWIEVDPAQIPKLRRQWHDRLDVPIVSVPHAGLFALCLIPPALWLRAKRRVASRIRRGQCPACGYDLRESPGACPECGRPALPPPTRAE